MKLLALNKIQHFSIEVFHLESLGLLANVLVRYNKNANLVALSTEHDLWLGNLYNGHCHMFQYVLKSRYVPSLGTS